MEPATSSAAPTESEHHHHAAPDDFRSRLALALAALGVVYGDLGTNVLFAMRECFKPEADGLHPTPENVFSVLSLIFWALMLVVVVKYISVVLRADNRGEGGILALLALLLGRDGMLSTDTPPVFSRRAVLAILGIFGTTLLLADGMITPAISVLSAIEGIGVAAPGLKGVIVPITVVILVGLFFVQKYGTDSLARFFGPAMLVWFGSIGVIGLCWVVQRPEVIGSLNPQHAVRLFAEHPWEGFFLLGAIVLCVTGAEALYADMGHFGRKPIALAWYFVAFPTLLLNYYGQGAFILTRGYGIFQNNETIHLFYSMLPDWLLYPMMALATLATIIASQALISGAFSLAQQAVELGYAPRLTVVHTSSQMMGQIYVPFVNWFLMIACLILVVTFKESSNLANAYGISVIGTMVITSVLVFEVMRCCWKWPLAVSVALFVLFLSVDLPFLFSNLSKVVTGGWVPLSVGGGLFLLMTTWRRGRAILSDPMFTESFSFPVKAFIREIKENKETRDDETAVVLTAREDLVPSSILQSVQRTHVVPGRLILMTIRPRSTPKVNDEDAVTFRDHGDGIFGVTATYGFMQEPDMGRFLALCTNKGLELHANKVWFYLSRMTLVTTGTAPMVGWRKRLFAFMYHNARPATSYYKLPPDRVVELGRLIPM